MVQRKIKWSHNALNDKLSIFEFWFDKNKTIEYPLKLEEELYQITQLLKDFDDLGKLFPKSNKRFIIKDHLQIIYTADEEFIEILNIWNTRQDPEKLPYGK
jgi:plasmid stabilization system protein ParE